jgi:protein gp37
MTNLDSAIEWTDTTWSPVTGCTKVSLGCDNCYAEGIARRFAGGKAFPNGFDVTLRPERLSDPLKWKRPRRVFVNSMSDLFHGAVSDEFSPASGRSWPRRRSTPIRC